MIAPQPLWVASFEVAALAVRLMVNGITVFDGSAVARRAVADKINPLLIQGANRVELWLARVSNPSSGAPPSKPSAPSLSFRVQQGTTGADPGTEGVLLKYEWETGRPAPPAQLKVFEGEFAVNPLPWPPPPWTEGAERAGDSGLAEFVQSYAAALRSRDFDTALRMNSAKFIHVARSLGIDRTDIESGFRRQLEELSAAPDWQVSVAPELQFVREADSRLVRVVGGSGMFPMTANSNGRLVPYQLSVSRLRGAWQIVR